jgi:NAD(P)-dependent dehydrogenase (short-subunit alcohol dehydrogenase family)
VRAPLFPLWQIDLQEYDTICAYLGLTPKARLYDQLSAYLAGATFRFPRAGGFSRFLARARMTRWRIARLDLATRLFIPDHPLRHKLNCVLAVHECDGQGYEEMSASPAGWKAIWSIGVGLAGFALNLAITIPWLGWQLLGYVTRMPLRGSHELAGRRTLISGVNRGLGRDLMLHCLEQGAEVIGIVRNPVSRDELLAELPANAPVTLVVADLSQPGNLVAALTEARIPPATIAAAILCAGVKHDGQSVLALPKLRDTFEVNLFSIAEFAGWLCGAESPDREAPVRNGGGASDAPVRGTPTDPVAAPVEGSRTRGPSPTTALVLVSSMGRWHGMHFSCGYNASKAALSIWGESLEMELRQRQSRRFTVTVVEPGIFASAMTRQTPLARLLFASRRQVASRIVSGTLAGRRSIRPPFWFALLTWATCLLGRDFRYRVLARAKPRADGR